MPLLAQTGAGTIQGSIKDTTGGVIPGASVTLLHVDTGRTQQTKTNDTGLYVFPPSAPGKYEITAEFSGMKTWKGEFVLQVGQTAVVDAALEVGAASTLVTVTAEAAQLVQTAEATLGSTIERARIEQLPLNGRYVQNLIAATNPGVEGAKVFGLRDNTMEYVQDGAVLKNRDTGAISARPPGLDTVQEFKVETTNSSAKMNRPATAILSTRSGTNELHGAAFETARNNAIGVARRRQDYYEKPPHLVRNEFGASLGGPVVLPKLYDGHNRTFFFGAWEEYRLRSATTTQTTMPTMAMREGDYSGLIDGAGRAITLYDPWSTGPNATRQPFPGNILPKNKMSPLAAYLYRITPEPTLDVNPLVANNFFGPSPTNRDERTITTRFDHMLNETTTMFVRFSRGNSYQGTRRAFQTNGSPMTTDLSANYEWLQRDNMSGVVSLTKTFSPTLFSETLFNASIENFDFQNLPEDYPEYASDMGLPNPLNAKGLPDVLNTGFNMVYHGTRPRNNITRIFNIDQNMTRLAGRHEFQFGGRVRIEKLEVMPDQDNRQGILNFNSSGTALYDASTRANYGATPRTGHNSANLFLGIAADYGIYFRRDRYFMDGREYAFYFQDNWRVNNRLTLNLGLRWESYPAIAVRNNIVSGFDFNNQAVVVGSPIETLYNIGTTTPAIVKTYEQAGMRFTTPEAAGLPNRVIESALFDLHPRVGFAYKLTDGASPIVVRGGYSRFGFPIPLRTFQNTMANNAPYRMNFVETINAANRTPDGLPNLGIRSAPTIIAGVNSSNVIDLNSPPPLGRGAQGVNFFDPSQPTSKAHQWNFTVEKQVWKSTVLRAAYVGTHGSDLEQMVSYNGQSNNYIWFATTGKPLPTGQYASTARRVMNQTDYGDVNGYSKIGYSNYNGINLQMERRFDKGFAFQVFYVMSNAFRVGGEGWEGPALAPAETFMPGAVPTDRDDRNRFLNYERDTTVPKHRLRWNWIVDLQFGKGKALGGNAGRWTDRLIGGWQLAGFGSIRSNYWSLPVDNWGYVGNIDVYGKSVPIEDCRSGQCVPGYLWYNGYIPANRINSYDANGKPNGVMGVPADYVPAHSPMNPMPAAGPIAGDPNAAYYDTDSVLVKMADGAMQRVEFDPGLHPWRNQVMFGPRTFGLDASLFKTVAINERFRLRFNADFFNVLNNPGLGQPAAGSGIVSLQNSAVDPRELQLTLRLMW